MPLRDFQFGLARMFGLVAAVALWLGLLRYRPLAIWFISPALLATAVSLATPPRQLRRWGLFVALSAAAGCFAMAIRHFPILVIADSFASADRSRDLAILGGLWIGIAVLASGWVRSRPLYVLLVVQIGLALALLNFASTDVPHAARWGPIYCLAVFVALQCAAAPSAMEADKLHGRAARGVLVIPLLLVMADYSARVALGQMAALAWPHGREILDEDYDAPLLSGYHPINPRILASSADGSIRVLLEYPGLGRSFSQIVIESYQARGVLRISESPAGPPNIEARLSPDKRIVGFLFDRHPAVDSQVLYAYVPLDAESAAPVAIEAHPLATRTTWWQTLKFSGDGRCLLASNQDGTVCVWDTSTWQLVHEFKPFGANDSASVCGSLSISQDHQLLTTSTYNYTRVWDLRGKSLVREISTGVPLAEPPEFGKTAAWLQASDRGFTYAWPVFAGPWFLAASLLLTAGSVIWLLRCWRERDRDNATGEVVNP